MTHNFREDTKYFPEFPYEVDAIDLDQWVWLDKNGYKFCIDYKIGSDKDRFTFQFKDEKLAFEVALMFSNEKI